MNTTIFWFSGTGNSLYAAKRLAEALGNSKLVPMASGVPDEALDGRIGFVFPSYYGDLPRLVRRFVEDLCIPPDADVFAVVTMGAFGQGSIKALGELLKAKGASLRYGVGVRINGNYILNYDPALFGAKSGSQITSKLNKADKKILRIAEDIKNGRRLVKTNPITAKTLYKDIESLDAGFTADEKCTGCGLCEKLCPVDNIKLTDGKPVWQHHCEHCVACISWCPTAAINNGDSTQKRMRYRNPRIEVAELEVPEKRSNNAIQD